MSENIIIDNKQHKDGSITTSISLVSPNSSVTAAFNPKFIAFAPTMEGHPSLLAAFCDVEFARAVHDELGQWLKGKELEL